MGDRPSDTLHFKGRILFLSEDPDVIASQLEGRAIAREAAGRLRDNVSTDEITPVPTMTIWDDRLGRIPYTGLKAGQRFPIGRDAIREAGFEVVVAGARYGKGSSREHSPAAERAAGVRLVIAESFERIYRQNADNIGLLTSTDFGLVERIRRGEPITLTELLADRDPLAAAILRAGGLIEFGQQHLRRVSPQPQASKSATPRPRTLFEKNYRAEPARHARELGRGQTWRRRIRACRLALHHRVLRRDGHSHAGAPVRRLALSGGS